MNNKGPKISIIIPIYNVEDYAGKCLESVTNQTLKDIEVICVDDGTKDNSCAVVEAYMKEDDRIKLVHKENGGLSSARNYGLQYATGEYIWWIDSDDYIEKNGCERLYDAIQEYHPDLIHFCDLTLNMQSGEINVGDISFLLPKQEYRLMEQLMLNNTMFLSTEDLLVKAWGFNTETDINSVWLYISYLRKRLTAMNSKVEIVSKRNIGYKLEFQP